MADFGVYFNITQNTGVTLAFVSATALDDAAYAGPGLLPSQAAPTQVHLNDPVSGAGATGTVNFVGYIGGEFRLYSWMGNCPVHGNNTASGPGIIGEIPKSGHPLNVNISIDANTQGYTVWGGNIPWPVQ